MAVSGLEVNENSGALQGELRWGSLSSQPPRCRSSTEARPEAQREGGGLQWPGTVPGMKALPYPGSVLDLVDPQLHGHVKAVQDVSAEHQGIHRGVDRMDPTWGQQREGKPPALGGPTMLGC